MKKKLAIVILTYNSEKNIQKTLNSIKSISKNIFIIDSYSDDKTLKISKKFNCKIIQRKFINYSNQRNWIINRLNKDFEWQLHLDADESLDINLIKSIKKTISNINKKRSFLIKRKYYFLGKKLNYPGLNEWHLRLFKSKSTTCENRSYDQHFITKSKTYKINSGYMHDNDKLNLKLWKDKHRRWAKMEAYDIKNKKIYKNKFKKKFDPRYYSRDLKRLYYHLPKYLRVFCYFIYRYFFKLGFIDGKIGFLFCFYQAFWFRLLVDYEISKLENE